MIPDLFFFYRRKLQHNQRLSLPIAAGALHLISQENASSRAQGSPVAISIFWSWRVISTFRRWKPLKLVYLSRKSLSWHSKFPKKNKAFHRARKTLRTYRWSYKSRAFGSIPAAQRKHLPSCTSKQKKPYIFITVILEILVNCVNWWFWRFISH